jgi:hypothetical protein
MSRVQSVEGVTSAGLLPGQPSHHLLRGGGARSALTDARHLG